MCINTNTHFADRTELYGMRLLITFSLVFGLNEYMLIMKRAEGQKCVPTSKYFVFGKKRSDFEYLILIIIKHH